MLTDRIRVMLKPIAKRWLYSAVQPTGIASAVYSGLYQANWWGRELVGAARRSLVATPTFLTRCAVYGENISCDRLPFITGNARIELGSNIRISGKIGVQSPHSGNAVLKIGNGVFIGAATRFSVARSIEIGNFVSIGLESIIADTEGHDTYNPNRPIWEVPASDADIAPIVIEDNVQLGRRVTVLKGVRIGARSIIGAGAYVRSNIPPDSVVMGNPGRVVRRLTPEPEAAPSESGKTS